MRDTGPRYLTIDPYARGMDETLMGARIGIGLWTPIAPAVLAKLREALDAWQRDPERAEALLVEARAMHTQHQKEDGR